MGFMDKLKGLFKPTETNPVRDSSEFDSELSAIPVVPINYNHRFLKTNYVKEMPKVSFSRPRKNAKYSGYGDFVVIDTETTGVSISNEIIEISAIKYEAFKPVSAFTSLIKPKDEIPLRISEITHITNNMVENSPTIYQVMPAFIEYVGDNDIVGHNLLFDLEFVYKYGFKFQEQKRRCFDTLDMSRNVIKNTKDHKLTTMCDYYGIIRNDAHRSLSDCFATAKLYINLLDGYSLQK